MRTAVSNVLVQRMRSASSVDINAALVLSQVSLVVRSQKNLHVGPFGVQGVYERLKDSNPILGSLTLLPKRGQSEAMRCAICQVELAVRLNAVVLRVGQTSPG